MYLQASKISDTMNQILSGYRVVILHEHNHSFTAGVAKSVGASVLHIYRDAPSSSLAEFETFWNREVQRADADGMTLIILKNRHGTQTLWCPLLEQMEENEWDGGDKNGRLRFVTTSCFHDTIRGESAGGLLYDSWGDVVERGRKEV